MKTAGNVAYSYVRFSSAEQAKGDGLRRQTERRDTYVAKHGLTLDTTLSLRDLGVSAFKGANASKGALSAFLAAVKHGKVKAGSLLLVESLDRISRMPPVDAFDLIRHIIKGGVAIVTLMDEQTYTEKSLNDGQIFVLMGILMRAHDESKTKTDRASAAWSQKRKNAAVKPLTSLTPFWITLDDGALRLDHEKSAIMKRIIDLAISGLGSLSIAKILNNEKVKRYSRTTQRWDGGSIRHLLNSRALIGEYQPHTKVDGKSIPYGEPLKEYYPRLIDDATFYRLQAILNNRKVNIKGRRGKVVGNLFGRTLRHGVDGTAMVMVNKRASNDSGSLVSRGMNDGITPRCSILYKPFEWHLVRWLADVQLEPQSAVGSNVGELEGRLAELQMKIQKVNAQLMAMGSDNFDRGLELLGKLNENEQTLKAELELEKARHHKPHASTAAIAELVDKVKGMGEGEQLEVRERIRSAIHAAVNSIRCFPYADGMLRLTLCDIELADGKHRIFGLRTKRGEQSFSFGLPLRFDALPFDIDQLAADCLKADTAEGMNISLGKLAFGTEKGSAATAKAFAYSDERRLAV